ncbi:efflux RND transporter permease subunit [Flectobacillus sp. BAB-3569]|uniref:efflux RND transporter permease subunit n=1 Tax=Flectobacillus sp. BAB-3569 TaxID=1509483 RepID=UPI000BA4186E|nr:efflux RND transporter permease subunit [Flectobacillus sp. BAB-3569]PAC27614.1 multidrug transporter AcrB [Flectobacillus sp. BAB-3569]
MKIAEFSVKNYQFTLVVFLAVLSIGLYSLLNMPRGEDPEFESPQFGVTIIYPGATPNDMEELVVDPFEKRINELDNIQRISTVILDGAAVFQIEYDFEQDPEEKYQEVVREVNAIRKDLPAEILDIRVQKFRPTDVNIYQFALVSENLPYSKLKEYADDLEKQLEKVKPLTNIKSWGFPARKVAVELNLEKMAHDRIPVNQVLGAIQSENVNIPGGSINVSSKKLNVKTSGAYNDLDEIQNTIVYTNGTKIVYLKDIAQVKFAYEDETHITSLNGHRCVFVTACQKQGQNIIGIRKIVEPIVEKYKAQLPPSVDVVKVFDQAESVDNRLTRFAKDFGIAILLVLITLLPLGTRASIVVMISIPLSLAIGLTLLNVFGYTINQLSIVGMIVALGILVDDSIVVVENIERFMRMGIKRKQAAIDATKQIGLAVVGCTVLLCFAFLPIANLPEAAGEFIRSLPMAVMFTVLASMIVSLTIVPFLSSVLLTENHNPEGNVILRGMKKIISATYGRLMDWCLKHPKTTLAGALGVFVGVMMMAKLFLGFSLFPTSEKPMFLVNIETPVGTNMAATTKVVKYVEEKLKKVPEIRNFASNVGRVNPRIYYNTVERGQSENRAQIFVLLEDMETSEKKALIDDLRGNMGAYPNAKIEVKDFEQGPPLEAPIAYRIFGENLDTLRNVAFKIEKILANHPGAIYVNNPLKVQPTDIRVVVNKEKAGLMGVSSAEIDRVVRLGIAGLNVGTYREDGQKDGYNINISIPRTGVQQDLDVFNRLYVNNALGTAIPLKQLVDIKLETSQNQILHFDKERYVTVSTFLKSGYNTAQVNQELIKQLNTFKFPKGFSYRVAGEAENAEKSFGGIGVIVLITVFGMIAILILEFRNFKSTLIVLSVIPLGIVGAILMLLLWGETLSFTAVIGFIALVGIEVKNSLLLVDFTNQLREEGFGLEEAIREAGEVRFVPIVLTSLTAIGGLVPLVVEYSELYSPLALVLIGGIISSTLLARLVTPVMYKLLPPTIIPVKETIQN